jgi:hypothetical protein
MPTRADMTFAVLMAGRRGEAAAVYFAEPALDRPGVVALVGERIAAGVPQQLRVGLELQAGGGRVAFDHPGE